jgi:hypothetical protein
MTKKFLELIKVYCDVMEEYPGMVQKIEEFRILLRSKEQTNASLEAFAKKLQEENQALTEAMKKRDR